MDSLFKISIKMFLAGVLIASITITSGMASSIQPVGDQMQKPGQGFPVAPVAKNYGSKLNERNAAAKKLSRSKKAAKPKRAGTTQNKNGTDKSQLSKHNQSVINQAEAAKQKRESVDKINAEVAKKK